MAGASGKKLDDTYKLAWIRGLKTTYYLRTLAATQVEKSTIDVNKFGVQPRWMKSKSASSDVRVDRDHRGPAEPAPNDGGELPAAPKPSDSGEVPVTVFGATCDPNDPTCEACQ